MTQHHDPVHPDEGDRPVPDDAEPMLAPQDEAYVTGLLAGLPPVEMPADVASELDAAIARESAARTTAGGGATTDTLAEPTSEAAPTVVPLDAARGRRARGGTQRRTRVLQAAAGVVLLVAGGVVAVDVLHSSGSGSESASGAGSPAPAVPVDRTGHTYTSESLDTDVQELTSGTLPTETPGPTPVSQPSAGGTTTPTQVPSTPSTGQAQTPTSPTPGSFAVQPYIFDNQAELVPCLAAVEDGLPSGVEPVAMDQGTYQGQPVLVVVLPGYTDPEHTYDVYIVGEDCGQGGDEHMLLYRSVPKP